MNELLDPQQLQAFLEVAQRGSVTEAATALHRSQPAISHRLRALEEALAVPLFEKVGRRLQLTDHGRRLQARCADLLAQTRELRTAVRLDSPIAGEVVVGTLPTLAAHLLVPAVAELLERHPRVRLQFVFDYVDSLHRRLSRGDFDLVVVAAPPREGFKAQIIHETAIVAAMAPTQAPRQSGTITIPELRDRRYLAWQGPDDHTFNRIRAYAEDHGLPGASTLRLPHMESLRLLCARGAGYTLLPEYVLRHDVAAGRLVTLEAQGLDTIVPISLLARRTAVWTPALTAAWRGIAERDYSPVATQ